MKTSDYCPYKHCVNYHDNNCDKKQLEVCTKMRKETLTKCLPCEMGDVMWGLITRSTKHGQSGTIIKSGRVTGIRFNNNMELLVTVHRIATGTIGKTIFCSKEAAEQALKERENNENQ